MYDKAVDTCPFVFHSISDWLKTQKMCNKAVDNFLPTLKYVPDWFVTKNWLKIFMLLFLQMIMYSFFDECSGNVIFTTDEIGVLCVNLSNINLDDDIFYEDDPKTITHARLLAWHNKLKQRKAFKKEITKELRPEA